MERADRKQQAHTGAAGELEEVHNALLALYDDLTETTAWTALVMDGVCGALGEQPSDVDADTYSGMRFASIWLKRRNRSHASALKAACTRLREIRGR
jgi:hypothetical protein